LRYLVSASKEYFGRVATATTLVYVNREKFGEMPVVAPPLEEQKAIAHFLEQAAAEIDHIIDQQQQLITLLEEERTTVISHAVTKGLDPSVPMKDSGIEWLGEIPLHWDIISSRRLIKTIEQGWSPIAEDRVASEGEWGVIKLSAVSKGTFRSEENKALSEDLTPEYRYEIKNSDFLLTRSNTPDLVGDVCVVSNIQPYLMLCDLVYRLAIHSHKIDKLFLCYWLLGSPGRYQIKRDARGSSQSMVKIAQNHIKSWIVTLPPVNEQIIICDFIKQETARIDEAIANVKEQIAKLEEYRTALISDAVTGKIDVRGFNEL
jgi:type I restriction enzyme S subunit